MLAPAREEFKCYPGRGEQTRRIHREEPNEPDRGHEVKARIAGTELTYSATGQGPAVVFLHAFPLGRFMWEAQAQALEATHTVVRFDDRGFGDTPAGDGLLTMERIADDAAALMDHLGLSQAVVGGCSMGGYATLAFARRHPDRLKGLVLQDTKASPDTDQARRNRAALTDKIRKEGVSAVAEAFMPNLLGKTTQGENLALVERVREVILRTPPQGMIDALAGLAARADSRPSLREIRVPTLVVCGEEDTITPIADSEELHRGIAGSQLAVIPGAGHLSNLEKPAAYNESLLGFLRSSGA
jgi:pimeloyl-ACP methyl ester carboxylesterase